MKTAQQFQLALQSGVYGGKFDLASLVSQSLEKKVIYEVLQVEIDCPGA